MWWLLARVWVAKVWMDRVARVARVWVARVARVWVARVCVGGWLVTVPLAAP